ncbi:MAG: hypothetical protein LBV17_09525 [Treponema sp.]|jgi:hypothetical protein|nr:hypothetical protein [Treponema sp.]
MKKKIFMCFLALIIFSLTVISCKSAPAPTPAPKAQQQATPAEIATVNSRIEKIRKSAMDFEVPSYFPSEWEDVEAQYATAKKMPVSNQDEVKTAVAALNKVADRYSELFDMTIPLYAQAREDEILAIREELVRSKFSALFPQYVEKADKIALTAKDQYEAKDYYAAKETIAEALDEYETLLLGAKILLARQEITDRDFIKYDPENFEKADEISQTAVTSYDAGNKKGAIENAEEALLRFNIVLTNGWIAYAAERRASATSEREIAIANKVNIAVRDSFREADTVFNTAEDSYKNENYSAAGKQYVEAEALFVIAGQQTEEKRLLAMETIRQAEEKVEESSETAIEAEKIIEGGSK